MKKTIN